MPTTPKKVDSKACLILFLLKIPKMLLFAVAGALLGSGLYLLITTMQDKIPVYVAEKEYYIDFAAGRLEAKDYYNAYTWGSEITNDLILGDAMERMPAQYSREEIESMLSAAMPSDIRYLRIYVKGSDPETVKKISDEMTPSMEKFARGVDEFDQIYQIRDNGVRVEVKERFTWRALLLGAAVGALLWSTVFGIRMTIRDRIYTREDAQELLQLPCFGMFTIKENPSVEKKCRENIEYACGNEKKIYVLGYQNTMDSKVYQDSKFQYLHISECNAQQYQHLRSADGIILEIPFGEKVVRKELEIIEDLKMQDCKILGTVITKVSDVWLRLYHR